MRHGGGIEDAVAGLRTLGRPAASAYRRLADTTPRRGCRRHDGDGEILGKADGGMLGGRVDGAADLRQEPGRRHGVEEIAAAARLHARHQKAGGENMGHDIDAPCPLPDGDRGAGGVGERGIEAGGDAGIGAEEADGPWRCSTPSMRAVMSAGLATSQRAASPPMADATSRAPSSLMSATITVFAPAPCKASHRALPMPLAPPVTTTMLPLTSKCHTPGDGRAAIDDDGLAGEKAAGRRGEEHRRPGDLARLADAAQRRIAG